MVKVSKRVKTAAGLSTIILSLIGLAGNYLNNKHDEVVMKTEYNYKMFQADSLRRNKQEAWQNSQNDQWQCFKDSIKKNFKCN